MTTSAVLTERAIPRQRSVDQHYSVPAPAFRDVCTPRQLDYWTRNGYLRTVTDPGPGSGYRRLWLATEIPVAARLARLSAAGVPLEVAEPVARAGGGYIAPGVRVTFWDGSADAQAA